MSFIEVNKSILSGNISIPSSKSQTMRALIFALMASGKSLIHNYLHSPDTFSMIEACRSFGAKVTILPYTIEMEGIGGKVSCTADVIYAGNSGIILRFCSALGALASLPVVVTGDYSIRYQRPIAALIDGLSQLDVQVTSMRGDHFAPLIIQGPIKGRSISIDGSDSQPVSALLIATAFAKEPSEIHVKNPGEKPFVRMTLDWFDRLGINYSQNSYEHFFIEGNTKYHGFEYTVPGDFSSAAFPIAAALITGSELTINQLDFSDSQGDKELISIFQKMGGHIEYEDENKRIVIKKNSCLKGMAIDVNSMIDAIPILSVVGCFAEGETRLYNGAVARQKECDRIACMKKELESMGGQVQEYADGLLIKKSILHGSTVHSNEDHRVAMSLIVAGLKAEGSTYIHSVQCINKTFPNFIEKMINVGAKMFECKDFSETF
ncbi:MAG: 3-phosphoshikimate 1-carboxyvinyltransferase [Parachlamydiaceae bacterium]|nr:3-phosphoshikimate 1-carboxyvinyltransferase [Parachlamydiaceae bacterium]